MLDLITKLSNTYKFKFKLFIPDIILKSLFSIVSLNDFYDDIANSSKNVISKQIKKLHPNLQHTSLKDL